MHLLSQKTQSESEPISPASLLKDLVYQAIDVDINGIHPQADLIALGLNSVQIMKIAGQLRQKKIKVKFADLIAVPRLEAWLSLPQLAIGTKEGTSEHLSVPDAFDEGAPFDLAPMQHAYWIGRDPNQYLGGVAAHFYHEFGGQEVVPDRLEQAVRSLFERHGMLRVQILDDGRQQIPAEVSWPGLKVHDFRHQAAAEAEQSLIAVREQLSHRQLDISQGEVFDVQLSLLPAELKAGGTRLHINLDMVAADAFSLRVLLNDLAKLYLEPEQSLVPLSYSYSRYQADRSALHSKEGRRAEKQQAKEHWQERLADLPGAPQLPTAIGAESKDTRRVVRRHYSLSADRKNQLAEFASRHGITLSMTLAAALAEVLTVYSEESDFLLNLPLFDRESLHRDVNSLVGDFTSSILLAWQGSQSGTFVERAQRLQHNFRQDVAYGSYSGVEVLRDLSRQQGQTVFAPVVFTSALGLGELFGESVRSAFGDVNWIISQGPQVWLDVQVMELKGGLSINWDAREAAFAPGVLDGMFAAFTQLLECLIGSPEFWAQPIPSLLPAEQKQQRQQVNSTAKPYQPHQLHEHFFSNAKNCPEAVALYWNGDQIRYGELAHSALAMAAYLQLQGVEPGDLVGILLPKGPEQIIAALGVLAAGAAYLPLGIDQPPLRRERVLKLAGAKLVIDTLSVLSGVAPLSQPVVEEAKDLAYTIFTSGSTGEPKGVEISHGSAWNTIADINERFSVSENDRVLAISALDFDLSVYDIFGLLSAGGALVLVEEESRRDAERWHQLVCQHGVTVWNTVPALLDMLLTTGGDTPAGELRLVLNSGDWISLDLPERLKRVNPGCRFIALGGATEASIWSNNYEVKEVDSSWRSIPYGYPLANQQFRVVDALGRDCPDWVTGELWIGGAGVALGYRGAPGITAARFVTDEGEHWYRTGDLGRYWPNGCLEFLGRADNQVKVRGHRIELGEIEAALTAHKGIAQAVALLTQRGVVAVVALESKLSQGNINPEKCFVDLQQLQEPLNDLREFLSQRLTSAMLPSELCCLAEIPLTANGKIDRGGLQQFADESLSQYQAKQNPPQGKLEQQVAAAWCKFLDVTDIARDDNFFALGGDSLLATRVVRDLRESGFEGVTLSELFSQPSLAHFAATLVQDPTENPQRNKGTTETAATQWQSDKANRYAAFEPTDVQRAYWLGRDPEFVLGGIGCHFYREYHVVDLDLERLESALNAMIARHEMLRAVFDSEGRQRILADVPRFSIDVTEVDSDPTSAFAQLRQECAEQVFEPSRWPLFDVRAVRCGRNTRLAIGLDNLILDAFSILLFYRELNILYQSLDTHLPSIELSFRDYVRNVLPQITAVFDSDLAEGPLTAAKTFWQHKLSELPPAPQLPIVREPASIERPHFVRHQQHIDKGTWQNLVARAAEQGITPSSLLLTAFAEVLSRWSSRPDLSLNLTLFDRREVHPDIYRVMGDFTSLTLVGYRPEAGDSWLVRAKKIQGEVGAALEHRDISSVSLMRELARRQSDAEATMPVVFTSALGIPGGTAAPENGPLREPVWALTQTPQVWLDHQVVEVEGGVFLNWDVVEALFPEGMCAEMFQAYIGLLQWAGDAEWDSTPPDLLPKSQRELRTQLEKRIAIDPTDNLSQRFFQKAKANPDNIALYWGDDNSLSYGVLAERALRITAWLLESQVSPAEVVAVNLPKGPDQIAAVLGVLAAGAAYLPVGIDQPQARRESMLCRADVKVVLDQSAIQQAEQFASIGEPIATEAEQLAYIIFTSGSTGEPKGVEISHGAAWNTIADINERFSVDENDRVLAISALDFDLSVYDIFGLLSVGGALVLIDEEDRRDAECWHQRVCHYGITIWNTVPALLDMLLTVGAGTPPGKLRLVLNSGDWIGLDLPQRLKQVQPDCRFIALGGATEASIWSNSFEVVDVDPSWHSIPYGYPLANQKFRVVDTQGLDCPDWTTGELWIGGDGVAMGYRGAPELTEARFVTVDGERWYRTGDLGRYWPNGCLEFLGRADSQVKVRGYRIELGEIETVFNRQMFVQHALVLATEEQQLVAAVVLTPECPPTFNTDELREYLRHHLPSYMVPDFIVSLPEMPLSANGKLDRASVLKLVNAVEKPQQEKAVELATDNERLVALIWQELLNLPVINRDQNFFELGGDSLLATRFIDRLKQQHRLLLPLRRLFASPRLADVAGALSAMEPLVDVDPDTVEEGVI
ncbi:amino acid adenylation domain-containing protein [Microbulbifer sp. 2304DJ12-6]|uniref:amino acid adenylation domain-containing protein n=1 Tax=Microbulbifer sp. 2304DJ12-6 TaxID=3233340 RepID=UPI0039AFECD8